MKLGEVKSILSAEVYTDTPYEELEVYSACGSDLMSDVLAFVKDQSVLITGLCNPQVIKTADMMDMKCVVIVRGKMPDESIIELARQKGITLMKCSLRMYLACGMLYAKGLGAGEHSL